MGGARGGGTPRLVTNLRRQADESDFRALGSCAVVKGIVAVYKLVDGEAFTELGGRDYGAGWGAFSHVSRVL